ncbi:hypothetical protein KC354_g103 [Hortaea werneckii]|nr:hypothetical protein KC354_g103 [Hortaea werneckii]
MAALVVHEITSAPPKEVMSLIVSWCLVNCVHANANTRSHTTRKLQNAQVPQNTAWAVLLLSLARFNSLLPLPTFSLNVCRESAL